MKENGLTLKNIRCKQFLTETLINTEYEDYFALFVNMPIQVESTLYSQLQEARTNGLYKNSDHVF